MGKDSIRLLAAIKKRLNFQTQRDSKIRAGIDGNGLGDRWHSAVLVCHRATGQSLLGMHPHYARDDRAPMKHLTETSRRPAPNGKLMHASIRIGDSTVMLVDEMPEHRRLSHTYCRQGQQAARLIKRAA